MLRFLWLKDAADCPTPADGFLPPAEISAADRERVLALLGQLTERPPTEIDLADVAAAPDTFIVAAVANDEPGLPEGIVGMATLIRLRKLTGLSGHVEDVVVDEACRGRGLAKTLMGHLHDAGRALKLKHINLTSQPQRETANRLYQQLGYERRDTNAYRLTLIP
ncbi:MAG: GNAT family N-acetyltransferase [Patescibacteria group bacterium]|nr:GNAT family N-acetyltransferase [Patescibacteria group bacterium]